MSQLHVRLVKYFLKVFYIFQLSGQGSYRTAVETMLQDLKSRFDYIINPDSANFNPTYIAATSFDPRYKGALTDDQLKKAKSYIHQLVSVLFLYVLACIHKKFFSSWLHKVNQIR